MHFLLLSHKQLYICLLYCVTFSELPFVPLPLSMCTLEHFLLTKQTYCPIIPYHTVRFLLNKQTYCPIISIRTI